jgi:hypothetical protein
MEITVQITIKSQAGEPERIQEVARLERGTLRPDNLGLSLAEARSILAGLEQTMAQQQVAEFAAQACRCPQCGRERACKGHHPIVFRTPFGKLKLDSPRLYPCRCESDGGRSFSPLAELLPERTSPELVYLETKFAALVSYGLTVKLLEEVLPIDQALSPTAIRHQVRQAAQRLESEPRSAQDTPTVDNDPPAENASAKAAVPLIVGLDGAYVHAQDQPSRTEGWFEVIVGKSLPTEDQAARCFGFVSRYDPEPERRVLELLKSLGLQPNQPVTFLSDGGETVRELPRGLIPICINLRRFWLRVPSAAAVSGDES